MTTPAGPSAIDRLLGAPDEHLHELIDGELVPKPASALCSCIAAYIASRLDAAARSGEVGWLFIELVLDCFPWRTRHLRRPSVCYVRRDRLPTLTNDDALTFAPDLCVDVVAPSDRSGLLNRKTEDYFLAGVSLVWHVFPETRTIHVFRPDGSAAVLRDGQTLTGGDVLPGFTVAVADVFPPRPA